MKKLLVVFLLCFLRISSLYAKADIYLVTGVSTPEADTEKAMERLEKGLEKLNPKVYKNQEFKSVYNTSHGFWDLKKLNIMSRL